MKKFKIHLIPIIFIYFLLLNVANATTKTIGILVFDNVLTSDITAPMEVFGAAIKNPKFSNYQVILIAVNKKQIVTEEGLKVIADKTISDSLDLDVLLVPSAYDMKPYLNNKILIRFLKHQADKVSWLGSNCSGALLLAKSGILDHKKATTWAGGEQNMKKMFPKVDVLFNQNVVIDKNIITSNGGLVSYQSALILLEKLSSKQTSIEIAEAIQIHRLITYLDVNN